MTGPNKSDPKETRKTSLSVASMVFAFAALISIISLLAAWVTLDDRTGWAFWMPVGGLIVLTVCLLLGGSWSYDKASKITTDKEAAAIKLKSEITNRQNEFYREYLNGTDVEPRSYMGNDFNSADHGVATEVGEKCLIFAKVKLKTISKSTVEESIQIKAGVKKVIELGETKTRKETKVVAQTEERDGYLFACTKYLYFLNPEKLLKLDVVEINGVYWFPQKWDLTVALKEQEPLYNFLVVPEQPPPFLIAAAIYRASLNRRTQLAA